MMEWLSTLSILERVMLYIAVPATLILLIQTVLLLIGLGGSQETGGSDGADTIDLEGDGGPGVLEADAEAIEGGEADAAGFFSGLNVFTVRGFVTFFTLFGWSGLLLCTLGMNPLLAVFLAVQAGVIGMVGVALILREALRLQADGTLNIRNALGLTGSVYLTVPTQRQGAGKVNVLVQEQLREFEAVTDGPVIPTGADIIVTGITGRSTLVVRELEEIKQSSEEREE